MTVQTLAELMPIAQEAVDRASKLIRARSLGTITAKGDRDPATEVDYAVERDVRDFLLSSAPDIGFLGEEDGQFGNSESDYMWALDPVDGTVNYINNIPLCAVSLGLVHRDEPVLGVIDMPFLELRYSAARGTGAFRGHKPISVDDLRRLDEAVVAIGDYAVGPQAPEKNVERLAITERLAGQVKRIRMLGAAAIDLAWVAEGRLAASVMVSNKPWDTAAGVLVAREAGAQVLDLCGEPHSARSQSTVVVAPGIALDLTALLRSIPRQES